MLKKIVAIKNVGRFRNSGAKGDTHLAKYSHVFGANGHGKTTLCAILRSLQNNDPAHLLGRKTLGVADDASVELLGDAGNIRFDGKKWSAAYPDLAIFDGTFISENVHSGEVVETDHKRSLYRVIIGHDGLHLAEEEARLAGESRTLTGQISAATKALAHHVPKGMSLDQFIIRTGHAKVPRRGSRRRAGARRGSPRQIARRQGGRWMAGSCSWRHNIRQVSQNRSLFVLGRLARSCTMSHDP